MDQRWGPAASDSFVIPGIDVLDRIAAFVVVLDRHGAIVHWNRACTELTGYALDEVRRRCVWDFLLPPDEIEPVRGVFARLQTESPASRFENSWVTRRGERRWITWSNSTVTDDAGQIACVIGTGIDTTEHKQLEEYLRAIFEHTFQFIGLLAPDGILLEVNRSALQFAGVAREDVVGRHFWNTPWWTHDAGLQRRLQDGIREAAGGRFVRFEVTHRDDRRGRVATVDFSLTPVLDGRGNVILIVPEGRDITEQKRVERWQSFLADAGTVLATTLDYEETLANVAALAVRSLADCCIVDLVEESGEVRRLKVVHAAPARPWFADTLERMPLDRQRPHLVWPAISERRPVVVPAVDAGYVASLAQNDEHLRALQALEIRSMMAVPLLARGRLLGALTFVSSSPHRQYRSDDLRIAQGLAERAALAVENARLYRAAQDAIEARDDLLAIVAHDLRNPLSAINATATVLRQYFVDDRQATAREAIDGIVRASARATRLVQDLLEVRRIAAGRLALERAAVHAGGLLAQCVEAHRALTSAARLELTGDAPDQLPAVWADRDRILQVFENLIGNAVKFTPAGGRITVGAERRGSDVVFHVSDNGPGIAPDLLPRLFDRFWQGHAGDRRGIGLGLAIAREVVEAHGGRIWVDSPPGTGSTFSFSIPAAPDALLQS